MKRFLVPLVALLLGPASAAAQEPPAGQQADGGEEPTEQLQQSLDALRAGQQQAQERFDQLQQSLAAQRDQLSSIQGQLQAQQAAQRARVESQIRRRGDLDQALQAMRSAQAGLTTGSLDVGDELDQADGLLGAAADDARSQGAGTEAARAEAARSWVQAARYELQQRDLFRARAALDAAMLLAQMAWSLVSP